MTLLTYLKNCNCAFQIEPLEDSWFDLDELDKHHLLKPLSPTARLLLTSDGSMTQMLEALTFSSASMDIERQGLLPAGHQLPELISASDTKEVLDREAWLYAGGKKLIYAHSLLTVSEGNETAIDSIKETNKPLGKVLREDCVKTLRTSCRIGTVKSSGISTSFGIDPETILWARYYRLNTDSGIDGIIFELFSPELLEQ